MFVFDNERPIYLQIVELIKLDIISGKINKGDKLLSVREYALLYKVNPNTMQKALLELEREKLIYTERTNGKYVTLDEDLINQIKNKYIDDKLNSLILEMNNIGLDIKNIIEKLNKKGEL